MAVETRLVGDRLARTVRKRRQTSSQHGKVRIGAPRALLEGLISGYFFLGAGLALAGSFSSTTMAGTSVEPTFSAQCVSTGIQTT